MVVFATKAWRMIMVQDFWRRMLNRMILHEDGDGRFWWGVRGIALVWENSPSSNKCKF